MTFTCKALNEILAGSHYYVHLSEVSKQPNAYHLLNKHTTTKSRPGLDTWIA